MGSLSGLSGLSGLPGMFGGSYIDKVLVTGPIAYWPQDETAGATAIDQVNSPAQDGAYTGVTLNALAGPDGRPTPFFDGAGDRNNAFTAALAAAFNGGEGSLAGWLQLFNAGVWTDATNRYLFEINVDGANDMGIRKTANNNELRWEYQAGGVLDSITTGGHLDVTWMHLAMTWSAANDELRAYKNGLQEGATQAGLGVWAGAPVVAVVGAFNAAGALSSHGYIAHPAIWDRPLAPAEMANLAAV